MKVYWQESALDNTFKTGQAVDMWATMLNKEGHYKKLLSGLVRLDCDDDNLSEKSETICKFIRLHV